MTVDRSIQGTVGNETLTGSTIDDLIRGREGDDIINGKGGTNVLDGGPGDDTVVFEFRLVDGQYSFSQGKVTISGPGSANTVTGFEHYRFADGTIDTSDGSPLVDDLFYNIRYKDVFAAKVDADTHYASFGVREGRDPNALFSTSGYLSANPGSKAPPLTPCRITTRPAGGQGMTHRPASTTNSTSREIRT